MSKKSLFIKILMAPVAWFLQACNPLGKPVNPEISTSFYYNKSGTDVIYSAQGNWFALGKKELNADTESFVVLNEHIGKDDQFAYYKSYIIDYPQLDLNSFNAKTDKKMGHIGLDRKHVFTFKEGYENAGRVLKTYVIEGADPSSYQQISFEWAKDHQNHFYKNRLLEVDYESFIVINDHFAKDNERVYIYHDEYFNSLDANAESFRKIDGDYARDSAYVYLFLYNSDDDPAERFTKIPCDEASEVRPFNSSYVLAGEQLYFQAQLVKDINVNHLKVLNLEYAKDDRSVFYQDQILDGADAASFDYDDKSRSYRDKNNQYRQGKIWVPDNK